MRLRRLATPHASVSCWADHSLVPPAHRTPVTSSARRCNVIVYYPLIVPREATESVRPDPSKGNWQCFL